MFAVSCPSAARRWRRTRLDGLVVGITASVHIRLHGTDLPFTVRSATKDIFWRPHFAGSFYELFKVRVYPVLLDTTSIPLNRSMSPDRQLGVRTFAVRHIYDEMTERRECRDDQSELFLE